MLVAFIITLGIIGMGVTIYGVTLPKVQQFWPIFWGIIALSIVAYLNSHWLFLSLELVIFLGLLVGELEGHARLKFAVPVISGLVMIAVLSVCGQMESADSWIGAAGLLVLAWGYAVRHPAAYVLAGVILNVYSIFGILAGAWVAAFWLVMNTVFIWICSRQLLQARS